VMDKAREMADNLREKAGDLASSIKDRVSGEEKKDLSADAKALADAAPGSLVNKSVCFMGEGKIEVKAMPFPRMVFPWNGEVCHTGVILKVLTSGICGSDLHPYRGRTTMKPGTVLGHEFTGEVVQVGTGVENIKVGDWAAVPFNVSCGTCPSCKSTRPESCNNANPKRVEEGQGGLYGYICGGNWRGGQAQYVFVPWADYNLLVFGDKVKAKEKLLDLTLLTDVLPTAMHGVVGAHVDVGSTVYVAGAGPIGLSAVACSFLKGAAVVFCADHSAERLALARGLGAIPINLNEMKDDQAIADFIETVLGTPQVDGAVEAVGYEAKPTGESKKNVTCATLNTIAQIIKPTGFIGVLGVFVAGDPKGPSANEKMGVYPLPYGQLWMKGISISNGQASVARYNRALMMMILNDKLPIARGLNVKVWSIDDAPQAYAEFAKGAARKMILDPNGILLGSSATSASAAASHSHA